MVHSQDNLYLTCSRNLVWHLDLSVLKLIASCERVSCMRQMALTQSGAPSRVTDWINFSHYTWILSKFSTFQWICLLFISLILVGVELTLCIIIECYNPFSGVKVNI